MPEPKTSEFKTACGGSITEPSKYPSAEYRGEMVYFCTNACKRAFDQAPDDFMTGEIVHPIDDD
ncbi:MAG: YHS domain-containing protein [Chloroflexi bacterium]|nr:YHS domain-containing protein [Chloroflexota bacterium]